MTTLFDDQEHERMRKEFHEGTHPKRVRPGIRLKCPSCDKKKFYFEMHGGTRVSLICAKCKNRSFIDLGI